MKYIIKLDNGFYFSDECLGDTYMWQGQKYANFTLKRFAKRYSTRVKAEHTMDRLIRTCANATNAEIEEVEE